MKGKENIICALIGDTGIPPEQRATLADVAVKRNLKEHAALVRAFIGNAEVSPGTQGRVSYRYAL